jgi:ABC-type glycerol-3-phosphate transport system substrate-binding protein
MKKIKFTALILMLIIVISACGTAVENPDNADSVKKSEFKDMDGAEFIFATGWTNEYYPEEGRTDAGDKMRKRYKDAEENFNLKFTFQQIDSSLASSIIMSAVGVGEGIPDMLDINGTYAFPAYKAGYLIPLEEIGSVDFTDEKWGPESYRKFGIFGGKQYGFYPYDWEFIPQVTGCLMFNNELIKKYNINPTPNELQEQGNWNWDNFKDILIQCTFEDNGNKLMGMNIVFMQHYYKMALMSNGANLVKYEDGKYVFGLDDERAYEAFDYIKELAKLKITKEDYDVGNFSLRNMYFFMSCESWLGTVNVDYDVLPTLHMNDWGFITFPNGPKAESDNVSSFVYMDDRLNWIVGPSYNDKNDLGLLVDYIFEPLDGTEKQAWKEFAHSQFFHSDETYENFINMIEKCQYDYSTELFDVKAKIETALNNAYLGSNGLPDQSAKIKDLVQVEIDKYLNS